MFNIGKHVCLPLQAALQDSTARQVYTWRGRRPCDAGPPLVRHNSQCMPRSCKTICFVYWLATDWCLSCALQVAEHLIQRSTGMHSAASGSRAQLRASRARLVQHGGAGALKLFARGQAQRQALRRRAARLVIVAVVPAVAGQQAHGAGAAAGDRQRQAAAPALHAGRQVAQQRVFLVEHTHILRQRDLRRAAGRRQARGSA